LANSAEKGLKELWTLSKASLCVPDLDHMTLSTMVHMGSILENSKEMKYWLSERRHFDTSPCSINLDLVFNLRRMKQQGAA